MKPKLSLSLSLSLSISLSHSLSPSLSPTLSLSRSPACSRCPHRCHVAVLSQRHSRALRCSNYCKTTSFRHVRHRTRLVQLQRANVALVSRSLIGVLSVYTDCSPLSSLRDLSGHSVPQAMAKQQAFAMSNTETRPVQPQRSTKALGGRSLIGVVNVYSDVLRPPCLRDLCGLFVPHAMAKPYDFATSNTELGSFSR